MKNSSSKEEIVNNDEEILALAKDGNQEAYEKLCLLFLDYVKDATVHLQPIIRQSRLDREDILQTGYLAACETIHDHLPIISTMSMLTRSVESNVMNCIVKMVYDNIEYNKHEILYGIRYETEAFNAPDEVENNLETHYRDLRNNFLSLIKNKCGDKEYLTLSRYLPIKFKDLIYRDHILRAIIDTDSISALDIIWP